MALRRDTSKHSSNGTGLPASRPTPYIKSTLAIGMPSPLSLIRFEGYGMP